MRSQESQNCDAESRTHRMLELEGTLEFTRPTSSALREKIGSERKEKLTQGLMVSWWKLQASGIVGGPMLQGGLGFSLRV